MKIELLLLYLPVHWSNWVTLKSIKTSSTLAIVHLLSMDYTKKEISRVEEEILQFPFDEQEPTIAGHEMC